MCVWVGGFERERERFRSVVSNLFLHGTFNVSLLYTHQYLHFVYFIYLFLLKAKLFLTTTLK